MHCQILRPQASILGQILQLYLLRQQGEISTSLQTKDQRFTVLQSRNDILREKQKGSGITTTRSPRQRSIKAVTQAVDKNAEQCRDKE